MVEDTNMMRKIIKERNTTSKYMEMDKLNFILEEAKNEFYSLSDELTFMTPEDVDDFIESIINGILYVS